MDFSPEQMARHSMHGNAMHEAGHALCIWYHDTLRLVPDRWPLTEVVTRPDGQGGATGFASHGRLLWFDEAYRAPPPVRRRDGLAWAAHELRLWHRQTLQRRTAELTSVYAGPIAQAIYHDGDEFFDEWEWADTIDDWDANTDWRNAEHARSKLGRRWRLHTDRAWDRATRIVRSHPNHIEALAAALIERNLVEGDEAFAIFGAAGPPIRLNRL